MWFFKKKVTKEEFQKFEKQVQKSLQKKESKNRDLNKQIEVITTVTFSLIPLSKQFNELQTQFTEVIKQFSNSSRNNSPKAENIPEILQKQEKVSPTAHSDTQFKELTQLEQKGLLFIGRLQNEAGSQKIPVGSLTTNLYPDRVSRKIKTTVSNILKKLIEQELIIRERSGNHWYIGLTTHGFSTVRKALNKHQLKNLIQLYEHN